MSQPSSPAVINGLTPLERHLAHGDPAEPESDSRLAANSISTIYSAYVSAQQNGAEVPVKSF